jgi:hypothetical protein
MTSEEVHEEGVWIISLPGRVPPFPCNFPAEWKEEAIKLAKKLKADS